MGTGCVELRCKPCGWLGESPLWQALLPVQRQQHDAAWIARKGQLLCDILQQAAWPHPRPCASGA